MGCADRCAVHGQILAEYIYGAAVDKAVTGHDTGVSVQRVELNKALRVQKKCDALTCQQLSGFLLLFGELGIALQDRQLTLTNDGQITFHTHVSSLHRI